MWFSTLHHGQKSRFKSKNLQEPVNYSNDNTVTWGSMTVKLLNNVEPIFQWLNFGNSDVDRYHSSIIHLNMFISYTVLSYNSWFWAICTTLYQKSNFIFGKIFCVGFEKTRRWYERKDGLQAEHRQFRRLSNMVVLGTAFLNDKRFLIATI